MKEASPIQSERIQILKMLEESKITTEEAIKLLESIEENERGPDLPKVRRTLRVRVEEGGQAKVNVKLPVSLAKVALKIAASLDNRLSDIDVDEVVREISSGALGPLVEIEHEKDKVIVTVE